MSQDLKQLANQAFERFQDTSNKIEEIKSRINDNRMGFKKLSDIETDQASLLKRAEREGLPLQQALERINGVPNFQDIRIVKQFVRIAESVGRIIIKQKYGTSGYGTGFLVAPGIILTNHHVFPDVASTINSTIQFFYEIGDDGEPASIQTFGFDPHRFFMTSSLEMDPKVMGSGLDFTLVAVKEKSKEGKSIFDIPHTSLDETGGKIIEGENCIVIQHPKGDYKKIVLKDIRMLTLKDNFLIYESDTLPGSSGAVVVGLGTGKIVALHHSSVPRKNEQGQWLKKDGSIYRDGDADESIDWIGNEGIRTSSLVNAIRLLPLSAPMAEYRKTIVNTEAKEAFLPLMDPTNISNDNTKNTSTNPVPQQTNRLSSLPQSTIMKYQTNQSVNNAINALPSSNNYDDASVLHFEIELSNISEMQRDWKESCQNLVPGFVSLEALFPMSTCPMQRSLFYLTLRSNENPWDVAAKLEALPQIKLATPDLPMETDLQVNTSSVKTANESDFFGPLKTSDLVAKEDDFKSKWKSGYYFNDNSKDEIRRGWNRIAVGLENDILADCTKNWSNAKIDDFKRNIKNLRIVQLDTGYTDHNKVKGRFNFENDEDFIDGDDARDDTPVSFGKFPGHGTRTASIIIGGDMKKIFNNDGNYGILCDENKKNLVDIIPYRIAETVVLIARGKNLVDAANQAIHTNADVMFMCMGSYPRPMIAQVAKAAYDNGVIWVCAAGNQVEMVVAPALYPGTIAVSAMNPNKLPWRGSSHGNTVDISAPGEDVYVPIVDDKDRRVEKMSYGDGTSYATPHVAAAAAAWKAKHLEELKEKYQFPWQTVEAFRHCLRNGLDLTHKDWDTENYGAGILHIPNLLNQPLPQAKDLTYAYNCPQNKEWDLGVREGVHFLWNVLVKKINALATESSINEMALTERGRIAMTALTGNTASSIFESDSVNGNADTEKVLNLYFESFK